MTKLFASLVILCFAGCTAIPFRAGVTYNGMTASYDGKAVAVDLDINGFKK